MAGQMMWDRDGAQSKGLLTIPVRGTEEAKWNHCYYCDLPEMGKTGETGPKSPQLCLCIPISIRKSTRL